ncbi:MAG: type II toxin-antitoxin system RelE/ParE family toxin [Legionellales bacterium]|nr:type II toxin-antitoxin system RelE/ParE family toxin [Legionellales bacterium]
MWEVEYTDEFELWWNDLSEGEQEDIAASIGLLEQLGPQLNFPHSSGIKGSKHSRMRELRIQHGGKPLRVLYVFDPRRVAILLLGGDKTGIGRWYEIFISRADKLYDEHLEQLKQEGIYNG